MSSRGSITQPGSSLLEVTPGPAKILVLATIIVPGDAAMPLEDVEAYVAQAIASGGVYVVRVDTEFVEAARV